MNILGVNEVFHETAASIVIDGKIINAAEEERFINDRHTGKYPLNAINFCLENAGLSFKDIDYISFGWELDKYINPLPQLKYSISPFWWTKNARLRKVNGLFNYRFNTFVTHPYLYFLKKASIKKTLQNRRALLKKTSAKVFEFKHHLAHAASTYRVSGFNKANIIIIDSRGEAESTSIYTGKGKDIELFKSYPLSHSIGQLYSAITVISDLGKHGEGKTMGLAPYGKVNKKYKLVKINENGYSLNYKLLSKLQSFGRVKGELNNKHKEIAASLQYNLEKVGLKLAEDIYNQTGIKNLCLAGGVTLNCVMNSILLESDFVKDIYIQPAANDAGVALGAALEASAINGFNNNAIMDKSYLGPDHSNEEIKEELKKYSDIEVEYYEDIAGITAELISKGKIIGWFQGRMEYGPRALGNRSILADPRDAKMKDIVNNKIKHREPWRPFAPSILYENMKDYFEKPYESPFMILNFFVKEEKRKEIPAVTHVDGSARVQSVRKEQNKLYYDLIKEFGKITGMPLLLNTSFNDKGQAIVCTPKHAIDTLLKTQLDYLVIGNYVVKKKD